MIKYFKSVIDEMREVTWSTRFQLTSNVVTVIQTTILYSLFIGGADYLLELLMKTFI